MNLKTAERYLRKVLNDGLGLDYEYEYNDDNLLAKHSITINGLKGDVYSAIRVYEDNTVVYRFTFDRIDRTRETLRLANEYNENFLFLKTYIDDEYLQLEHVAFYVSEENLEEYTKGIFDEVIAQNSKKYLKPLCDETYD